jgi:hypothetical protein
MMSRPKKSERQYELVDVDVSIVSLDYAAETTNVIATGHAVPPLPTLPTGALIDGKNTLQSFEGRTAVAMPSDDALEDPVHPTLPGGAVITGKNTLQSFNAEGQMNQPMPMGSSANPPEEVKPSSDDSPNSVDTLTPPPPATVMAVAVDADIIYADIAPLSAPWYKKWSTFFALLVLVAVSLALGLGLYFGLATYDPFMNSITSVPNSAPIAVDPYRERRVAVLTSFINKITLSNQTITANGTSAESKALAWMIANDTTIDTANLLVYSDDYYSLFENDAGFAISQRYPLLTMWFQKNETVKWAITTGWLVEPSECAWYGISCGSFYDSTDDENSLSIGRNVVTKVAFNLVGSYGMTIPHDIGLLSNLKHFEIKGTTAGKTGHLTGNTPYLRGTLPVSIAEWTALTHFDVSYNALNGKLPINIGQWIALTYFDASYNALTERLPDSIGQWTTLTHFDVNFNSLLGTLPDSIGQWTALTFFSVGGNALNGTLPDSIGEWNALTFFDVGSNRLNGTLPSFIGNWSLIEQADFSKNHFVGSMPKAVCQFIDQYTDSLLVDCTVNCTCCTVSC